MPKLFSLLPCQNNFLTCLINFPTNKWIQKFSKKKSVPRTRGPERSFRWLDVLNFSVKCFVFLGEFFLFLYDILEFFGILGEIFGVTRLERHLHACTHSWSLVIWPLSPLSPLCLQSPLSPLFILQLLELFVWEVPWSPADLFELTWPPTFRGRT